MELIISDRIRNRVVKYFNSFKIGLKYNSISSTFSFDFYYDPEVLEQKEMACVGHYHICQLKHNGELILTGQMLSEAFSDSSQKKLVAIGGYSLPGILEDCNVPTNEAIDFALAKGNLKLANYVIAKPYAYPIQDNGLTIRQIAQKYLAPFKIDFVVDAEVAALMDQVLKDTSAEPKDTVKGYLTELCSQKNINLSHDVYGRVLFTKAKTNQRAILDFNVPKGGLPGVTMDLHFDGQQMHSQITVVKDADVDDKNSGQTTVNNPFVFTVFRPKTIQLNSGSNFDTKLAAENALADELRGLKLTIHIDRWNINGKFIFPDNIVTVTNPEIYLFKKTKFFIESIDYEGDHEKTIATLHCVLPETYNGQTPSYLFSGINLH